MVVTRSIELRRQRQAVPLAAIGRHEVLVVDSQSTDDTADRARARREAALDNVVDAGSRAFWEDLASGTGLAHAAADAMWMRTGERVIRGSIERREEALGGLIVSLRDGDAGRKAKEAIKDLRDSEAVGKARDAAKDAIKDLREGEAGRKAKEALRDLRDGASGRSKS